MGQAFYRKYRSKKLDEIVGQKPVTTALTNALKSGQISHAYLFTGPRGVGKTSVARILAHEINDLAYTSDEMPIDIIEIDAASNRRIDEIRDLREKVRIAPVSAKYKVYIIDEVHMLTREAFNALLKTLEEPPAHVIFILATTEAHKLPETIISRTQRYSFKLATPEEVKKLLLQVSKAENIDIDDESLQLIAEHSGGSLRDALSLLDQIRHSASKIDADLVRQDLGLPSKESIARLIKAITSDTPDTLISEIQKSRESGSSAILIASQMMQALRLGIINKKPILPIEASVKVAQDLLKVATSSQPDIQLELVLLEAQFNFGTARSTISEARIESIDPPLTVSSQADHAKKIAKPKPTTAKPVENQIVLNEETWDKALNLIKQTHNTLYGILRIAKPDFGRATNNQLILEFKFPFHQKRMDEPRNKEVIATTLEKLDIKECEILCELAPKNSKATPKIISNDTIEEPSKPTLDQIRNIFGGVEVLE